MALASKRTFHFYPLESRILLSGEAVEGLEGVDAAELDAEQVADALMADGEAVLGETEDSQSGTSSKESSAGEQGATLLLGDPDSLDPSKRIEVIFVDPGVEDAEVLIDSVRQDSGEQTQWLVYEISGEADGVEQITGTLSELSSVDAVHLVSHGDEQGLQLGNARLDVDSASGYAADIASWSDALDSEADLLIYGCDLAGSAEGRALVDAIGELADCDVAASDDMTGSADLGGDWHLEYTAGVIDTSIAFSESARAQWDSVLATFTVTNNDDSGAGSLRQAIDDANATAGTDTIEFDIAGGGQQTISLDSALPFITDSVIIDGTTQSGFGGDPLIELDGNTISGGNSARGFDLRADNSTIRGFVINGFGTDGIAISGDSNTIVGNWIGLDSTGTLAAANDNDGIHITGYNNVIGGTTAADRNVISGNADEGIEIGAGYTGTIIQGNYIGTDATGTATVGNGVMGSDSGGIFTKADNTTIGGTDAGAGNVIAGNAERGIRVNAANAVIQGNWIGTDASGADLGNQGAGVLFLGNAAIDNLVGGTAAGEANTIAYNDGAGVSVEGGSGNSIRGNAIHSNGGLGIDLRGDGVTANDADDGDSGPNALHNFPELSAAATDTGTVVIRGTLNTIAGGTVTLDFYASGSADSSGYGEAARYLGSADLTMSTTTESFEVTFAASVATGEVITATATDGSGNTSELSAAETAVAPPEADDDAMVHPDEVQTLTPLSYFRLGDSGTSTASDVGSSANDGTYNGATLGETGALSGDADTAVRFDGVDDYLEIAHHADYMIDEGAVQLWFNADSTGSAQTLFSKDHSGTGDGGHFSIELLSSGELQVRMQDTTTSYFATSTDAVTAGDWHHMAATFGSDGLNLYLNGEQVAFDGYTGGWGTSSGGSGNAEPIAIGAGTQGSDPGTVTPLRDFFAGQIDEVAIFGSQLSESQIKDLHASGIQHYGIVEDATLTTSASDGVLANDWSYTDETLTATLVDGPSFASSFSLNSDGSFSYTPTAGFSGTDTFTYQASDGPIDSDIATVSITVDGPNDAPVHTVPSAQSTGEDTALTFSTAEGNAISVSDPDIGFGDFEVTLDVSSGSLTLAQTTGLTFTAGGDGTSSMTVRGTSADVNAALDGLTYTPTTDFYGTDALTISTNDLGNTGTGGAQSDSDTVDINVNPANTLWLTTEGDVASPSGAPGADSWSSGTALELGGTDLALEAGTTSGSFSSMFDLDSFAGDGDASIDAIHHVGRDITVGASTTIDLFAGDVLLSVAAGETLTSTNSATFGSQDVFVFRPDAAGDYSSGTFELVIDGSDIIPNELQGISLVEQDTVVGDVTLSAGEFLLTQNGNIQGDEIYRYTPDQLGGTSSGSVSTLIDGREIDLNKEIVGVDVVENEVVIGGRTFTAGQILVSLSSDDSSTGDNAIATSQQDMFVLDVSATGASTAATAELAFEGADIGLDTTAEDVSGLTLFTTQQAANQDPVAGSDSYSVDEAATLSVAAPGTLSNDSDPDGDSLSVNLLSGPANASAFQLNSDGSFSYTHDGSETSTDSFTYTLSDGRGGTTTGTVDLTINPVNDEESLDTNAGLTLDEGATATVTAAELFTSDPDNTAAELVYTLDAAPANGTLKLDGTALGATDTFTQDDLDNNRVTYTHDDSESTSDSFDFTVDDGAGTVSTGTFAIAVSSTNDNSASAISDTDTAANEVEEYAADGTAVGVTAFADDVDDGDTISYSLDDDAGGRFAVDANTGEVTVADGSLLDREAAASHDITVRASSSDGSSSTRIFTINLTDNNDNPPVVTPGQTLAVDENSPSGTSIGNVAATDPDSSSILQDWQIVSGNADGHFALDAATGELTVAAPGLDFESDAQYTLQVQVSDGKYDSAIETVVIDINDVNEAPVAVGGESYSTQAGESIRLEGPAPEANDSDVDGDSLSAVIVTQPPNGTLSVADDGTLVYQPDGGFYGTETIQYQVSDGSLKSNVVELEVEVVAVGGGTPTGGGSDGGGGGSEPTETDTSEEDKSSESEESDNEAAVLGEVPPVGVLFDRGGFTAEESAKFEASEAVVTSGGDGETEGDRRSGSGDPVGGELVQFDSGDSSSFRSAGVSAAELEILEHLLQEDLSQGISWQQWDQISQRELESISSSEFTIGAAGTTMGIASVGYVLWALRGGMFLGMLSTGMPSWRMVDPTTLLTAYRAGRDSGGDRLDDLMR